ncbi:MAG: glycosyltransferase family 4 protein [Chloroflexi bacterium]|nr:glycosyltransferase family 4 protein [Chloroflexota bacterium]
MQSYQRGLHILSIAPTSFFGDYGCHVRILEEARALKRLGHDVTILTYYKGNDVPGFRIIRTLPTPWHGNYEVGSSRHKFAFDALLAIKLIQVLSRNRFDVIHAHLHEGALIGSVLAKPWHTPVCFDYQGSLTSEMLDHGFLRRNTNALGLWQRLERFTEKLPAATFTSTLRACDVLRAQLPHGTLIEALPDGVNTDTFHPDVLNADERAARRMLYGINSDDHVVVFLGLLARHQGIQCIIEAAAILKATGRRVRWLVMGYPGVSQWQQTASAHGVGEDLIFTDRVPYDNAPHMLALGDIAIAPKLSLTEGSGKILNYMAMGLPTVAFDTPAQVEYLGNLGVYAPVGNVELLAQHVAELIDQPTHRAILGQRLRARVRQHFGWDRVAQRVVTVYNKILTRQPGCTMKVESGAPHTKEW